MVVRRVLCNLNVFPRNVTPAHLESGVLRFIHYNYSPFGEMYIFAIGAEVVTIVDYTGLFPEKP